MRYLRDEWHHDFPDEPSVLLREIDATDRAGTLPYRVRVRVLSRLERFYAHPPEGDWE